MFRAALINAALALPSLCIGIDHAAAELGPCTIAAPTTPTVTTFVSNVNQSVRWYRDNIGLDVAETTAEGWTTLTARNGTGVTLAPLPGRELSPRWPQAVCFVLDELPAPPPGSKPVYLADPDGTSVELPPRNSQARKRSD